MTDGLSEAERHAFAREAATAIEAVLDRKCPEMKRAFWTAVDRFYQLDPPPQQRPGTRPNLNPSQAAPSR